MDLVCHLAACPLIHCGMVKRPLGGLGITIFAFILERSLRFFGPRTRTLGINCSFRTESSSKLITQQSEQQLQQLKHTRSQREAIKNPAKSQNNTAGQEFPAVGIKWQMDITIVRALKGGQLLFTTPPLGLVYLGKKHIRSPTNRVPKNRRKGGF